ncbi:uncharacterized protein CLUP02_01752 [Colletotrichum lupini]|uniref:Uncharacterized protein n=1 Tax=Colletotrichum lupini TaxID=145971 RepID=A0A9Q8W9G6_9PEZI|nr:uncharacterized protein CLUP02_01752 [Colletotrichum lupini]UQC75099.1 hypothetical protein CLUP02_01752 [Colletotrichum lupini]
MHSEADAKTRNDDIAEIFCLSTSAAPKDWDGVDTKSMDGMGMGRKHNNACVRDQGRTQSNSTQTCNVPGPLYGYFPSLSLDFLMQSTYRLRREPAGRVGSKFVRVWSPGAAHSSSHSLRYTVWHVARCLGKRRSSPRSQKFFPGRLTKRDADRSTCLSAATLKTKLSPIEILLACLHSKRFVALSLPSFSPLFARPPLLVSSLRLSSTYLHGERV